MRSNDANCHLYIPGHLFNIHFQTELGTDDV